MMYKKIYSFFLLIGMVLGVCNFSQANDTNIKDKIEKITFTPKAEAIRVIDDVYEEISKNIKKVYSRYFEDLENFNSNDEQGEADIKGEQEDFIVYINLSLAEPDFSEWLQNEIKNYSGKLENLAVESDEKNNKELASKVLDMIQAGILTEYTNTEESFFWCPCTSIGERIYTILLILRDVTNNFSNAGEPLYYTSLGSGSLWQDFLTVRGLLQAGYKKLNINIIDFNYPTVPLLAKTEEEQLKKIESFEYYDEEINAIKIDAFKTNLAKIISFLGSDAEVEINIFTSPYDLLNRIQKNPEEKNSILLMVDPGHGLFPEPKYPSQANSLALVFDENNILLIFMQIGRNPIIYGKIESNPPKEIEEKISKVKKMITQLDATNNYRPKFLNALINEGIIYNPEEGGSLEIFSQILPESIVLSEEIDEQGKTMLQNDPHIAFQDLVRDTAKSNAIIYTLTQPGIDEDSEEEDDLDVIPKRFTKAEYIDEKVVTPNNGLYYSSKLGLKDMNEEFYDIGSKNLLNLEVELLSLKQIIDNK